MNTHSHRRRTWLTILSTLDGATKVAITLTCFAFLFFLARMFVTLISNIG